MLVIIILCIFAKLSRGYEYDIPVCSSSPWPMFRRDNRNSGYFPYEPEASSEEDEPWFFQTDGGIFSTPVLGCDETVFIGSSDYFFYAIDPENGTLKWKKRTGLVIDAAGVVLEDKVVFPSSDGKIYAVDPETGEDIWTFEASEEVYDQVPRSDCSYSFMPKLPGTSFWFESNVVVNSKGQLFVGCDDNHLYSLDSETGSPLFLFNTAPLPYGSIWSAPATIDDQVFVTALNFGIFSVNSSKEGSCIWTRSLENIISASPTISNDNKSMYIGSWDGKLWKLRTKNREYVWQVKLEGMIYSSAAITPDGKLYVTTTGGYLYCLDESTGEILWEFNAMTPINSSPAVLGDRRVFFGGGDGKLYCVDGRTGLLIWAFRASQDSSSQRVEEEVFYINSSPSLGTKRVYFGTDDGKIWGLPFDYCTLEKAKKPTKRDARCEFYSPELPDNFSYLTLFKTKGRVQYPLSFLNADKMFPIEKDMKLEDWKEIKKFRAYQKQRAEKYEKMMEPQVINYHSFLILELHVRKNGTERKSWFHRTKRKSDDEDDEPLFPEEVAAAPKDDQDDEEEEEEKEETIFEESEEIGNDPIIGFIKKSDELDTLERTEEEEEYDDTGVRIYIKGHDWVNDSYCRFDYDVFLVGFSPRYLVIVPRNDGKDKSVYHINNGEEFLFEVDVDIQYKDVNGRIESEHIGGLFNLKMSNDKDDDNDINNTKTEELDEDELKIFLLENLDVVVPPLLVSFNQIGFHSNKQLCSKIMEVEMENDEIEMYNNSLETIYWCLGAIKNEQTGLIELEKGSVTHYPLLRFDMIDSESDTSKNHPKSSVITLEAKMFEIVTGGPIITSDEIRFSSYTRSRSSKEEDSKEDILFSRKLGFDVLSRSYCLRTRTQNAIFFWFGMCNGFTWDSVSVGTIESTPISSNMNLSPGLDRKNEEVLEILEISYHLHWLITSLIKSNEVIVSYTISNEFVLDDHIISLILYETDSDRNPGERLQILHDGYLQSESKLVDEEHTQRTVMTTFRLPFGLELKEGVTKGIFLVDLYPFQTFTFGNEEESVHSNDVFGDEM